MLSFQKSGTKLKVINALFKSRFCLINHNMVDDEQVLNLCELANSKEEFISKINQLKLKSFQESERRNLVLESVLSDIDNAKKIEKIIGYEI
jgi:hypothetical protein